MNCRTIRLLIIAISVFAASAPSFAAVAYLVKEGDKLSKIAGTKIKGPVWGKAGSFKTVLKLNPRILDPNFIVPGEYVLLPTKEKIREQKISETSLATKRQLASETVARVNTNPELAPAASTAADAVGFAAPPTLPAKVDRNKTSKESFGSLSLGAGFYSSRISATENDNGQTARLVTKSNSQLSLAYSQRWTRIFETSFHFAMSQLTVASPLSGGSLNGASADTHDYGINANWYLTPSLKLGVGTSMNQQIFLIGTTTDEISLEPLYVPRFSILSYYDVYHGDLFSLGFDGQAGISKATAGSVYRTNTNMNYVGGVHVTQRLTPSMSLETGAQFIYDSEDTTLAKQSRSDLGVFLRLNFILGERIK